MERADAIRKLRGLEGQNLRRLAERYKVTVWKEGKLNKGWAGHVLERYLGLPLNSSQSPNFGSWELKIIPLKHLRTGKVAVKETMAITMIDPVNVLQKEFEESHLLTKPKKIVVCARMFESRDETSSSLVKVSAFDLNNSKIYEQIKADYNAVRKIIRSEGFQALTGKMGIFVQPRTKGAGHGTTSRAFYARKALVSHILGLSEV